MIRKIVGHRHVQTTVSYAHVAQDSLKDSAARVAVSFPARMEVSHRIHCPMIQGTQLPLICQLVDSSSTEEPRCRV